MPPQTFIDRLQQRCANVAIGPSTLRGKGTTGAVRESRAFLAEIDLSSLAVKSRSAFLVEIDKLTLKLEARLPPTARAWGRARKALNIFLRDVVYNGDLCRHYRLAHIRKWLELPLDSHIAKGLRDESEELSLPCLPRWRGVVHLKRSESDQFQSVASDVARRRGVSRVDLDVFYWRAIEGD